MKGQHEIMRKEDEKEGVLVCFKGGLFLEAFPIKPLKSNLQKLDKIYAYKKIIWLNMLIK